MENFFNEFSGAFDINLEKDLNEVYYSGTNLVVIYASNRVIEAVDTACFEKHQHSNPLVVIEFSDKSHSDRFLEQIGQKPILDQQVFKPSEQLLQKYLFIFPFRGENRAIQSAANDLKVLSVGDSSVVALQSDWTTKDRITIFHEDYSSLKPNTFLNNSVINFFMNW